MTDVGRQAALEAVAAEVRACTKCRLHEGRTRSVPGEGDPDTEVVFVGEGPGFNEDREGRPFVGRAGGLLVQLLRSIGWTREQVFITNVVKCRPPDNRDPAPDEIAACQPYLRRQLEVLDPALVVTLGRYSMGAFMPGARIGQVHGTSAVVDPATGARAALVFAMYHPAAALRSPDVERTSYDDMARIPETLLRARRQRERASDTLSTAGLTTVASATIDTPPPVLAEEPDPRPEVPEPADVPERVGALPVAAPVPAAQLPPPDALDDTDQLTLF
jgi:DNA polymerase